MLKDEERVRKTQSAVQLEKLISQFMFNKAQDAPAAPTATSVPGAAPATNGAKP